MLELGDWGLDRRPLTYYLDEQGEPVGSNFGEPQMLEWYARSWEPGPRSRRVAEDHVDGYRVSTVFLSLDHQFGNGPPVLWETMIFDPQAADTSVYCERYTSREAAARGHARVVAALLSGKTPEELDDCDCVCDND